MAKTKLMRPPLDIRDYMLFNSTQQAQQYYAKVKALGPIAYWPMWEASGAVATDISGNSRNGAYTGVTLGQTGIGDGRTCPLFDGANDFTDIHTASFANAFNGGEITIGLAARVFNVGVWTDGQRRDAIFIYVNGANYVYISQFANNILRWEYTAGGVALNRQKAGMTDTDWMFLTMTCSASLDEMRVFYNGDQEGAVINGLGVWAGLPIATWTCIGATRTVGPVSPWYGWLSHCFVLDYAATPAQIASLAVV